MIDSNCLAHITHRNHFTPKATVIPAKAGIQRHIHSVSATFWDSRFRGNDEYSLLLWYIVQPVRQLRLIITTDIIGSDHNELLYGSFGNNVCLTPERLEHIRRHPEMIGLEAEIGVVLDAPDVVRRSRTDRGAVLFYRYYRATSVGDKWLCVVTKSDGIEAFIVTAYLTDKIKQGEELWPIA